MKALFDITIDFSKSKGSYVYDKKLAKNYLDLFSMYSTLPLGYNHPIFDKSYYDLVCSVAHIRMTNNMFYSDELLEFISKFKQYVFSDNLHFTCTGALALESAIKCAMVQKKVEKPIVISLERSFHGLNSWGFITDRFAATSERMKYYPKNDWLNLSFEDLEAYFSEGAVENLVAIVLEPIQCTAGDLYIPLDQIARIRELCTLHDVCLIVDEIQTGFGVSGSIWYSDQINLRPDILVFGKKTQISGLCASDKYAECITSPVQKLEVTYDGDLIDAIRSTYILKAYEEGDLIDEANKKGILFRDMLEHRVLNYRATGLLIAFDFETKQIRDRFTSLCFQNGMICNGTGEKAVRMRPNLAISQYEIDDANFILDKVFQSL